MRLLAAFARWAAYAVGWFAGWGALGAVLTWRSFRKHQVEAGQRLLLTYREAGGSS